MEQTNMLKIEDLSVYYGPICAIKKVDLEVNKGEIVALIGSNGAGKTTLLNAVLGLQRAKGGKIIFQGKDITKLSTDKVVKAGISVVPEGRGMLANLTVLENLQLGTYHNAPAFSKNINKIYERFPILYDRKDQYAGTLSGGEQQMLAISRAIIGDPKLILLDEPSLALSPAYVDKIFKILVELKEEGLTILLSEQNARKSLQYSDRGYVLDMGATVMNGKSEDLAKDPAVISAYLGGE